MSPMPDVTRFFHPVLPARKLGRERPVGITLAGRRYALFRDAQGRAAALEDVCPHRFAPLSAGRVRPDGRLACGYHGWNFDADGRGRSPSQPTLTRCDVASFQVIERYGYLWLAAREVPEDRMPVLGGDGFELVRPFGVRFLAPLHVAFDNFSEDEHTPWVHNFLGWTDDALERLRFEARSFDDRTEVHYDAPQRRSPWTPVLLIRRGDVFHNNWVTRFDPPCSVYTLHWEDPATGAPRPIQSRFTIYFVPETERSTWLHVFGSARLLDPRFAFLLPVIRRVVPYIGWNEVRDDARWIPHVADTPLEMKGMRLGRFDKPLIHNHKLLRRLYWGESASPAATDPAPHDATPRGSGE